MMIDLEFPRVTAVRHVRDHVLWLRFSDGVEGTVDLAGRLGGGVFEPLRDPQFFAQVRLESPMTIEWPNGADVAPEALYDWLEAIGPVQKRDYGQLFDDAAAALLAHCAAMPEISRFFGIVIRMHWVEHEAPHFHAVYGEYVASIDIRSGRVSTYGFPPRALRRVLDWRERHQSELLTNWERTRRHKDPLPIEPLKRGK